MSVDNDDNETDTTSSCCASCGISENDGVGLKKCTACYLVRYCGTKCQRQHWSKHKRECKKRAAELDEILFKQPESTHLGDCPICLIPIPLGYYEYSVTGCCLQYVCDGCNYANQLREIEAKQESKCPFCREPYLSAPEEIEKLQLMKRVKANDPVALHEAGKKCCEKGDYKHGFEYLTRAVELGNLRAHYDLSIMYRKGNGVEKDEKKNVYHLGQAAIDGHLEARCQLGAYEGTKGNYDRAAKHFIIGAKLGDDNSLESVKKLYQCEIVSKEDFAAALRAHQAAVDTTKSLQREEASEKIDS
mmetsp:Transcript_22681/g.32408  ORF Transcript_22681/g.32408 Transcript_22681/m.32408 type:complete len:303 (+) Transcript_22681:191-1099(+)